MYLKNLNISCETIKILEENIGSKFQLSHIAIFLPVYPLGQGKYRKKINKWDYIKLRSFCTAKETIIKMKKEPTVWEDIFANDTSDKGLVSKIYKELIRLNTRKTNNPI